MSRMLFFAVILAVVYFSLRSYQGRASGRGDAKETDIRAEDMVRCLYCGVHLPKSESIMAESRYYCCEAHRRAHQSTSMDRNGGK